MILCRKGSESWLGAAVRYGGLEGVGSRRIFNRYTSLRSEGYQEREAAFLTLAELGVIDGAEV